MTSLAELLEEIAPRAWSNLVANAADADDARRALAIAAALLDRLSDQAPDWGSATTAQRGRTLKDVVLHCRRLAMSQHTDESVAVEHSEANGLCHDASRGRLTEVMAVASDLVSTMSPQLSRGERWAVCAALLDPICACAGVVRESDPNTTAIDLDRSLQQLRWWVTSHPPTGQDTARLDQARPSSTIDGSDGPARLQQLIDVVTYKVETSRLEPFDAGVAAAAGLHVALYAKAVTSACGLGDARTREASDALIEAWFGLRDSLRDVVDDRATSDLLVHVADLAHQLVTTFGPPSAPDLNHDGLTSAQAMTAFRGLVNRLPALARGLGTAAGRWGSEAGDCVFDPAIPIAWRDRKGIEHYAGIAPTRVPILAAGMIAERAMDAARRSAVIAARVDGTAMRVGHQPHPNLIKAHIELAATTRERLDDPESRWCDVVADIDARACRDYAWPMLARTLDRAAQTGWDVRAHLPALGQDLPARQTALELTYRVLECCDIPATIVFDHEPRDRGRVSPRPERLAVRPEHAMARGPSR